MEVAGIVISGVGLVALGNAVEDIFSKVSTWRHHGEDYQQLSLELDMAKRAYQRWHQTVRLADPNLHTALPVNIPHASKDEVKIVERLLGAIETAFRDVEKTTERYETEADSNVSPVEIDEKISGMDTLAAKTRAVIKARQTGTGAVEKLRWVVHDKKVLGTLIEKVAKNVKRLVNMFPQATQERQERLAIADATEMVPADVANGERERQQLVQLRDVAAKVDPILQAVAAERITEVDKRHSHKNVRSHGKGRILAGDDIAEGFTAPRGPGNSYDGIEAHDESRIHAGDKYGGRSFWD